jgi:hypothetical protein
MQEKKQKEKRFSFKIVKNTKPFEKKNFVFLNKIKKVCFIFESCIC